MCSRARTCILVAQPFVVSLADIEHVHFEGVGFGKKSFEMVIIFKAGRVEKGADEFVRISTVPMNKLDDIKDWLLYVVEKVVNRNTSLHSTVMLPVCRCCVRWQRLHVCPAACCMSFSAIVMDELP